MLKMAKRAKCDLKIAPKYGFGSGGDPGLGIPPDAKLTVRIELVDFVNEKDWYDLPEYQRIADSLQKKEQGNAYFKAGDLARATRRYGSCRMVSLPRRCPCPPRLRLRVAAGPAPPTPPPRRRPGLARAKCGR